MKRIILYAIPLLIIGIGIGYFVYNKPHQNIQKADAELVVSATDLYSEYDTDEPGANAKYLDKVIAVTGVVKEVSQNEEGRQEILLDTGTPLASVACSMDHLSEHKGLDAIQKGDKVKLKGICTGMLMDVIIDRAVIVE